MALMSLIRMLFDLLGDIRSLCLLFLLSFVFCLLSFIFYLLSFIFYLLSFIFYLLSFIFYLLSFIFHSFILSFLHSFIPSFFHSFIPSYHFNVEVGIGNEGSASARAREHDDVLLRQRRVEE